MRNARVPCAGCSGGISFYRLVLVSYTLNPGLSSEKNIKVRYCPGCADLISTKASERAKKQPKPEGPPHQFRILGTPCAGCGALFVYSRMASVVCFINPSKKGGRKLRVLYCERCMSGLSIRLARQEEIQRWHWNKAADAQREVRRLSF